MLAQTSSFSQEPSLRNLCIIFTIWKTLIWLIAYTSPGIGYDTSSDLSVNQGLRVEGLQNVPSSMTHHVMKFVRWDAIYYLHLAQCGHIFEQEWAFGTGVSTILATTRQVLGLGYGDNVVDYATAGVLIAHMFHFLSIFLLYSTARILQGPVTASASNVPYVAAILHIVSPAGIFLSAPCSESSFAFLNMLGFWLYAKSTTSSTGDSLAFSLFYKLLSGMAFGCASIVRSNGIFGGIPLLIDAFELTFQLLSPSVDYFVKSRLLLQFQFTVIAGLCVAAGTIYPQFLAYREYCVGNSANRPWCSSMPPSIYTFVQSHYWNVGFLKYWTLSNVPLFLLAAPCLTLLIMSGWQGVRPALQANTTALQKLRLRIALPQLVLALLALTNFHVQIITRLASAYPFWYVWLASRVMDRKESGIVIRVLTMYGLIQAGLFAGFLPPA